MTMKLTILLLLGASSTLAYQPTPSRTNTPAPTPDNTRRLAFLAVPAIAMGLASPSNALDMDAFMAKELGNSDKKAEPPKMNDDEALCKFGAPAKKTGEACLRAGLSTKRPSGVDAFGTVDREYTTQEKSLTKSISKIPIKQTVF